MKNKIFRYISFFAALIMILGACQKTDIQKANDEYDFDKIIPVVLGIDGPAVVNQTLSADFEPGYYRGGSTFAWSSDGATVTSVSEDTRTASVNFPDSGWVSITLVETTLGGVVSDPFSADVYVQEFCPIDFDEWEGDYTGTDGSHSDVVTLTRTTTANEMYVFDLADFVQSSWGENWTSGSGRCVMAFSCGNIVTIPAQTLGNTDYPDTYTIDGSGTFDPATNVITLDYTVYYTGGDAGLTTTVLTPSSKGGYTVTTTTVPPKKVVNK